MKFNVNQQDLQKSLNYCQGVIEKRSTLPILSNVLLDASNLKLTITATDLDMIFIHSINNVEIIEEGKTTTTSSIMYDIIRKFSSGKKINFSLSDNNNAKVVAPCPNFFCIYMGHYHFYCDQSQTTFYPFLVHDTLLDNT